MACRENRDPLSFGAILAGPLLKRIVLALNQPGSSRSVFACLAGAVSLRDLCLQLEPHRNLCATPGALEVSGVDLSSHR